MKVTEDQFRFEWFSGTGKGGQHRNKHQNCCRCIHEPTGTMAIGTSHRSRESNKREAYRTCLSRVQALFHQDKERFRASDEVVRTYHAVDNRVVDHASSVTDTFSAIVENADLDEMLEARLKAVRYNERKT